MPGFVADVKALFPLSLAPSLSLLLSGRAGACPFAREKGERNESKSSAGA